MLTQNQHWINKKTWMQGPFHSHNQKNNDIEMGRDTFKTIQVVLTVTAELCWKSLCPKCYSFHLWPFVLVWISLCVSTIPFSFMLVYVLWQVCLSVIFYTVNECCYSSCTLRNIKMSTTECRTQNCRAAQWVKTAKLGSLVLLLESTW